MMDFFSPNEIKRLLARHGARASKRLGQNFLVSEPVLKKIIDAAGIRPTDTVVEVGPGIGTLTRALAQKAKRVVAIEKDPAMIEILRETLRDFSNIEIIHADALHFKLQISNFKLTANIPYYLTSPLIRMFLESENPPESMTLMVQKEVAQRICANPPRMSLLAVAVQFYAEPRIVDYVKRDSFWPKPNVDSAIISIVPAAKNPWTPDVHGFFAVVRAGFAHPRKQLANNLAAAFGKGGGEIQSWLLKSNITPTRRAETLSIDDWFKLSQYFPS